MVVTGPPGSGKSALIGRVVTLSVPDVRKEIAAAGALRRDDPIPQDNAVDIAIHAKGKSVFEVATALGQATRLERPVVDQPGIVDTLAAIEQLDGRRTIVIDALDEASQGQAERIANEIIRPLAAMPRTRVLVGTRRSLDGQLIPDGEERHGRLVQAFGPAAHVLDLEDEPETEADIAEFVGRRLSAVPQGQRGEHGWIADTAQKVAGASGGSFLYARLVARSLEATSDAVLEAMPVDAAQAFMQDIASRFPKDIVRVTDMLRALAFGLGLGLSRAVWAPIASALSETKASYADNDIVEMLRHVGSYIIETTVETDGIGKAVYRLIHQALADNLQRACWTSRPHALIMRTLMNGIEGEAWLAADAYIARHLAEHAAQASDEPGKDVRFDRLFDHPGFLAMVMPDQFIRFLNLAEEPRARQSRDIYRLAAADLRGLAPAERWAHLHLQALTQAEDGLAKAWMPPNTARFRGLWAQTQAATPHLLLQGHTNSVNSVALGAVGGRAVIVSGDGDGTVRLWDAVSGTPIGAPLMGHNEVVLAVALGEVGGRAVIVSGSSDKTVRLWDAASGAPIGAPLTGHDSWVESVALGEFSGRAVIVSGSYDQTVRLWDAVNGAPIGAPLRGHDGKVTCVALGEVGGRAVIVSGSFSNSVRLWDAVSGTPIGDPMTGHDSWVTCVALGEVGGRAVIVSGSYDKTVRLWDAASGAPIGAPLRGDDSSVNSVALGEVGGRAVIVSGSMIVRLWEAASGAPIGALFTGEECSVNSVAFGAVGGRAVIVSGSRDGSVRLWDAASGMSIGAPPTGLDGQVNSLALGEVGGRAVIVSGSRDGSVRLWDAASGAPIGALQTDPDESVLGIALGEVGGRAVIVSGSSDKTVRLWDAVSGTPIGAPLMGHNEDVLAVALEEVGGRAVIVSGSRDGSVRLWDAASGTPIGTPLRGHDGWVDSVALGEVGGRQVIVSGSWDKSVRLWDAASGTPIGAPLTGHDAAVRSVALGAVGGRAVIVSGSDDRTVRLWNAETGADMTTCSLGMRIFNVAISDNGHIFAATSRGIVSVHAKI